MSDTGAVAMTKTAKRIIPFVTRDGEKERTTGSPEGAGAPNPRGGMGTPHSGQD
jgi:hypothetical protein